MLWGLDRIGELRSYIGLTGKDEALLRKLYPVAVPHFRAIADEFYAAVRMHEGAFRVLRDEAQAQRLHAALQRWLGELLQGPYDESYVERHARIGHVHVDVGLELRYVVSAMACVRGALQRVAASAFANDVEASVAVPTAIARVCDLDLAIMLESYNADLVRRVERARAAASYPMDGPRPLLAEALEAAEVAVLAFDAGGHLAMANRSVEKLTGFAFDELADIDLFASLFGEKASAVRDSWFGATAGHPVQMEGDLRTRAGKAKTVRWHATAREGSGEGSLSTVVVGVDMTAERENERNARHNERLAATGSLAAALAHEIRNPLNGANLHVSVLERALARSVGVPPAAHEATDVLRAEIKRLGALVTDFLEVARPRPIEQVDCDANEIAREVVTRLSPEAQARKVVLEFEPSPYPARARLDVDRARQALVNLVQNGLEAVREGGHVVVRVHRLPHHLDIQVADDGLGVADPSAPIFDAFYTTKERGTGLGLAIVHRVVSDHGGEVRFESRPGSTVFTLHFPIDLPAEPQP